jgi:hypothetical protein
MSHQSFRFDRLINLPYHSIAIAIVMILFITTATHAGDTICIPTAFGVPALSGPPTWWNNPVQHAQDTMHDDPRWVGAASMGFGSGTIEEGEFRALKNSVAGKFYLYLSWYVINPTWDPASGQFVVVGFCPKDTLGDTVSFKINPFSAVPPDPSITNCATAASFSIYTGMNGTPFGGSVIGTYPWLDSTRVWIFNDPGQRKLWAVHMRIPIGGTGLHVGNSSFRMWYQIQTALTTSGGGGPIKYIWPSTGTPFTIGTHKPPALADWAVVYLGTSTSCHGISLRYDSIGTRNSSPNEISFTAPNTFFASPYNGMSSSIPAHALHGRFRIANWGSQADWNDIPHPDSVWKEVPGGHDVTNGVIIPSSTYGSIGFNWSLTPCDTCGFYPSSNGCYSSIPCTFSYQRRKHQCMLVELYGPGLGFLNNSVYRNMDFVHASSFSREAEISVKGLADKASLEPQRDVYLYVEKLNMPDTVKTAPNPDTTIGKDTTQPVPNPNTESNNSASHVTNSITHVTQTKQPMYLVHVYRDIGDREQINGTDYPILKAQTSFGYVVSHEGSLVGWNTILDNATQIGPNLYKVSVPKNGVITVKTSINALESFPKPVWMKWIWIIILIIIILIFVIRKLIK